MIRASGPLTLLVVMVVCLHACDAHFPDSLAHTGVQYDREHLKHARGRFVPAGGAPGGRDDDEEDGEAVVQLSFGTGVGAAPESEVILREDTRYFQPTFKSVRVDDFKMKAGQAESYHDVLRLFLGDQLSDDAIDEFVINLSRQSGYLSRETARLEDISLQGTQPTTLSRDTALAVRYGDTSFVKIPPKMHDSDSHDVVDVQDDDVMLADAPMCENCHVIASSPVFKNSPKESRRIAHMIETIKRRKRRHRPSIERRKKNADTVRNNKCKSRRKQLSDSIKKCKRKGNRQRCRKLRERYQRLRRKCKRPEVNLSGIPSTETAVLPDVKGATVAPPSDNTSLALTEEPGIRPTDWERWEETKRDTAERGQCGRPVAQTVRVRDLTHRGDEEYVPPCVLVYRCRPDSGCCPAGQECGPSASVNVSKSILLGRLGRDGLVEFLKVQHFLIPNHTECACRDIPQIKERPCPYPFNYSLHECRCVKESLQDYCSRIEKGRASLATSDKQCVLAGECRPLDETVCPHFISEEGRCLRKREYTYHREGD